MYNAAFALACVEPLQWNPTYKLRAEKVLGAERKKRAVAKIATTLLFLGAERGI